MLFLLLTGPLLPLYALHHADLDMVPCSAAILYSSVPVLRGPTEVLRNTWGKGVSMHVCAKG